MGHNEKIGLPVAQHRPSSGTNVTNPEVAAASNPDPGPGPGPGPDPDPDPGASLDPGRDPIPRWLRRQLPCPPQQWCPRPLEAVSPVPAVPSSKQLRYETEKVPNSLNNAVTFES